MMSLISLILVSISLHTFAATPRSQGPDLETLRAMGEHNTQEGTLEPFRQLLRETSKPRKPFAEYQTTGYVFFDDDDFSGYAREIKNRIAETLPEGAKLVVYTTSNSQSTLQSIRQEYERWISSERLLVMSVPNASGNSFWSRDALPVPVWSEQALNLVDARYYHRFEPDDFIASLFSVNLSKHNYFFEGGNFIANALGDCIVVNRRRAYPGGTSDTGAIPDSVFQDLYGCNKLLRLRHLKGIGHSDEVVKFMGDNLIVTDTEEYVPLLEEQGYDVRLLPEGPRSYETYVNSLIVNDTLYLPIFGDARDEEARKVYEDLNLGLKIVPLNSRQLAGRGQGGIHCITKNYPPVEIESLTAIMGAQLH